MAYLTPAEMNTHLYTELQNAITDNNDAIVEQAIATAMDEARGYLTKYDIDDEFDNSSSGSGNKKLYSVVKDIAAWHIIRLANPNIDYGFREDLYKYAVDWLKMVQSGRTDPKLPLLPDNSSGNSQGGSGITWDSNPKRRNQF